MERILVAGIDTVAGGNFAAWWANRYDVCGLAWSNPVAIDGCRNLGTAGPSIEPRELIAREKPTRIVFCGVAAAQCWGVPERHVTADVVRLAGMWAKAANAAGVQFVYLSSDAVFTGPWLFHREQGTCYCNSQGARNLRAAEQAVCEAAPESLIVRTHVFGWSPVEGEAGFTERLLEHLRSDEATEMDYLRHATPILATDLADMLEGAFKANLTGIHHAGGAERVNPFRFACLLAEEFGLEMSLVQALETPMDQRRAWASGETSLQTRRIKRMTEGTVPLLRDGLTRFHEQELSGYRDRFQCQETLVTGKAA